MCLTSVILFYLSIKKKVNLNVYFNDSGFCKVYEQNMIVNNNRIKHKPIVLIKAKRISILEKKICVSQRKYNLYHLEKDIIFSYIKQQIGEHLSIFNFI